MPLWAIHYKYPGKSGIYVPFMESKMNIRLKISILSPTESIVVYLQKYTHVSFFLSDTLKSFFLMLLINMPYVKVGGFHSSCLLSYMNMSSISRKLLMFKPLSLEISCLTLYQIIHFVFTLKMKKKNLYVTHYGVNLNLIQKDGASVMSGQI